MKMNLKDSITDNILPILGFLTISVSWLCLLLLLLRPDALNYFVFYIFFPVVLFLLVSLMTFAGEEGPLRRTISDNDPFSESAAKFILKYVMFCVIFGALVLYSAWSHFGLSGGEPPESLESFNSAFDFLKFQTGAARNFWMRNFGYLMLLLSYVLIYLYFILIMTDSFATFNREYFVLSLLAAVGFFAVNWFAINFVDHNAVLRLPDMSRSLALDSRNESYHFPLMFIFYAMAIGAASIRILGFYMISLGISLGGAMFLLREIFVCRFRWSDCTPPIFENISIFLLLGGVIGLCVYLAALKLFKN